MQWNHLTNIGESYSEESPHMEMESCTEEPSLKHRELYAEEPSDRLREVMIISQV